jgi:kanamycin kinase
VATVRRLTAEGRLTPQRWAPEHRSLGVDGALAVLADPPDDDVVVCHGDACLPNTLLDPAGAPVGHVDLGSLGRGDRWADVAVATWSLGWNLGPGWEPAFLDGYGVRPDPERAAYHRLLWDLCP